MYFFIYMYVFVWMGLKQLHHLFLSSIYPVLTCITSSEHKTHRIIDRGTQRLRKKRGSKIKYVCMHITWSYRLTRGQCFILKSGNSLFFVIDYNTDYVLINGQFHDEHIIQTYSHLFVMWAIRRLCS